MRIKKIKYSNWANDSLDVFVTLENDASYLIEVATPQFLSAIMEKSKPGDFNQAMMELGALICKPGNPECSLCPVSGVCGAFLTSAVDTYPQREKRKAVPVHHIAVGVVWRGDRVLITRRKTEGFLGGLWEFPGGKIQHREKAQDACVREVKEETNLSIAVDSHLDRVKHAYTHF